MWCIWLRSSPSRSASHAKSGQIWPLSDISFPVGVASVPSAEQVALGWAVQQGPPLTMSYHPRETRGRWLLEDLERLPLNEFAGRRARRRRTAPGRGTRGRADRPRRCSCAAASRRCRWRRRSALPPRAAERVADDDGDVGPSSANRPASAGGASGSTGSSTTRPAAARGLVDSAVGAHEAVARLGDQHRSDHAHDPPPRAARARRRGGPCPTVAAHSVANADGSTSSSSTSAALGLRDDLRRHDHDVAVGDVGRPRRSARPGRRRRRPRAGPSTPGRRLGRHAATLPWADRPANMAPCPSELSELFDPSAWRRRSRASTSPTSRTTAPSTRARCASPSTAPRCATPSARTPSTSSTRRSTTPACRPTSAACCSPATARRRTTAGGRSARRRPAHPRQGRLQVRRGRHRRADRPGGAGRLHILECQRLIRFMPKVVICVVPGWAAGGGHSLHVVCDLTLASAEHARFKQTDADVASFDGGFGSAYLARQVGQKFAREIFFLGREYTADDHRMGAVNAVVPHAELEATALEWAAEINAKSPTAQRMLKYAFNLIDDGLVGQQLFAGEATRWPTAPTRRPRAATPSREARRRLVRLPVSADAGDVLPGDADVQHATVPATSGDCGGARQSDHRVAAVVDPQRVRQRRDAGQRQGDPQRRAARRGTSKVRARRRAVRARPDEPRSSPASRAPIRRHRRCASWATPTSSRSTPTAGRTTRSAAS